MKFLTALALASAFLVPTLSAQTEGKTPSELASGYFAALQEQDFTKAVEFYDPAALASFRGMLSFIGDLPDDEAAGVLETFFGEGATKETVKTMSDTQFFANFFEFVMGQMAAVGGVSFDKVQVLGEVPEGEELRHVLTRVAMTAGQIEVEAMEVVSFTNREGEWKMLLTGEITGIAEQLKETFSQ